MNISRRDFLKSVGILAAGSLFVPDFRILLPNEAMAEHEAELFKVRKLCAYDISPDTLERRGKMMVRYDVSYLNRKKEWKQYHVLAELPSPKIKRQEFIERYHRPMTLVLKNQILNDKVLYKNLIPLAYPSGYQEPAWFTSLIGG